MITEDYVSFETAKLLKERGFDSNTNCYYIEDSVTRTLFYSPIEENHNASIKNNEFDIHINISSGKMSAPTLQMAMKWLREKGLDIDVSIEYSPKKTYYYSILKKTVIRDIDCLHSETNFKSYEEACEASIKYCLENLI